MLIDKLKNAFNQFETTGEFDSYKELASGHINDTYFIQTNKRPYYVLQRINHGVFKDIPGLIENKVAISQHIQKKLKHLTKNKQERRVLQFVKTKKGASYYNGSDGSFWNMSLFIEDSVTFETVLNIDIAYEGGRLLGEFLTLTNDFDVSRLIEVIPKFHDMSYRYAQFKNAKGLATERRYNRSKKYIKKIETLKEEMHVLQKLKESGEIKTRVTHNDAKISNILFSKENKGLCVIDTDTVMPGIIHYDFGDAIRTSCTMAEEDETNLDLVEFNMDYYRAFTKGFLKKTSPFLSPLELELLPLGAKTMIFIMGLRFLTDYLNGDKYYKIKYQDHNFDRAKNQFKLLDSFSEKIKQL